MLREIGEALYGDHWISPLARALGVNVRTMQRWAAAQNSVPPESVNALLQVLSDRHTAISKLLVELWPEQGG